ncbi:hypothetical protein EV191_110205 [Tamaricihabitans halophyticus]|uniref:Uncharacterized protein n=1 Tax=Tamaricihabitans halophyticus TaxID=1262583 RepID=A0A4R2QIX1_9PSEU|nr:hypothetical protein [Tamaricihabitans halophyticus]TCP48644.1 hypothetical protein EV191_110205 [Tamaricihabitans halophyticus]
MRIRTDDEVYRVDAVWLGPPKATFPWRARYVAWGVGIPVFLIVLTIERQLGFGFGFFTTAWAFVITIALTRIICARISHERPLSAVFAMWLRELTTPRERGSGTGGAASATRVRVNAERPRPRARGKRAPRSGGRDGGYGGTPRPGARRRASATGPGGPYPARSTPSGRKPGGRSRSGVVPRQSMAAHAFEEGR